MRSSPVRGHLMEAFIDIETSNISEPNTGLSYIREPTGILSGFEQSSFKTRFEHSASEHQLESTHRPSVAFPKRLASIPCMRWL